MTAAEAILVAPVMHKNSQVCSLDSTIDPCLFGGLYVYLVASSVKQTSILVSSFESGYFAAPQHNPVLHLGLYFVLSTVLPSSFFGQLQSNFDSPYCGALFFSISSVRSSLSLLRSSATS